MTMQLKVIAGSEKDKGRSFEIPHHGSLHLGRGPETDSRFTDVRVSGSHCRIYSEAGRMSISDNGSTNGTFVNERPLAPDELRDLCPGDMIRLGENTQLEVAGDDIAVMKTVAGNAGMLAREIAAAAARLPPPAPPFRPAAVASSAVKRPARAQPAEPTVEVQCACGQTLVAREKYAGTRVRCPNCRDILHLPGRAAMVQPVEEEPSLPAGLVEVRSKFRQRALAVAIAALLLIVAGVCLGTLFGERGKSADGPRKAVARNAARE
jgi:predicted component of type VI protein secretion system